MANTMEKLAGADEEHGYRFGCDGLVTRTNAAMFLDKSPRTIDRYLAEGLLRGRRDPNTGKVSICRKSMMVYIDNLV